MPAASIPACPAPRATLASPNALTDDWLQWIAENRLRGCTPASMLETLLAHGQDRAACQTAIAAIEHDPSYRAATKFLQLQAKLASVLLNQQRLWEQAPGYAQVERRAQVSRDEFAERYVRGSRPLVLTELARDWPALARWTPERLKQRFGHLDVEIQANRRSDARYEQNKLALRRRSRLSVFIDQVVAGGATNDHYLTANNEMLRQPEFAPLLDDIGSLPECCDRSQLAARSSFWLGPAGTVTPLHHDTVMLLHTQVIGRKRWRFISPLETPRVYNFNGVFSQIDLDQPDFARYPLFRDVKVLDVTLEPGETIFVPLGWWHHVTALEVSVSFSFSNLAVPNEYEYANPSITNW